MVQSLVIANSTILDASLAELLSSRLRFLKISRSNISAESLEAIARIKSLRELLLSRNVGLTDRGVASLARLPELRKLYLHRSNITGSGFAEFPSDSKLEVLYVYRTGFDSIGCKYVSRFKELRFLAAGSTNVSDTGILHLSKLEKLERLTPCLDDGEFEVPNGSVVLVAEYSGLHDKTHSGRIIIDGLMEKGIVPLASGSRGVRVMVSTSCATEARVIIGVLIQTHNLNARVVEDSNGR